MDDCLDSRNLEWGNYVSPQFHLIIIVIAYLCSRTDALTWIRTLSWIIDVFASAFLLFGTYERKKIMGVQSWPHDCHAALTSDYEPVSNYFVFSLVSWLAIAILETNSCIYVLNAAFGRIELNRRTFVQWMKICGCFVIAANSVIVMLHFSTDVHQSFDYLTKDIGLVLYFWIAATVKTFSVFMQGVFFCSWFIDHPFQFVPQNSFRRRTVMFRMALVSLMDIYHVLNLTYFGIFDGHPLWTAGKMTRLAFLVIDLCYRSCLLSWYLMNSYCFLLPMTQRLLSNLKNRLSIRVFVRQRRDERDIDPPVARYSHEPMAVSPFLDQPTNDHSVYCSPTQVETTYDGGGKLVVCSLNSRVMGCHDNQLINDNKKTKYIGGELVMCNLSYNNCQSPHVYQDYYHLLLWDVDEITYCATPPAQASNRDHLSEIVVSGF